MSRANVENCTLQQLGTVDREFVYVRHPTVPVQQEIMPVHQNVVHVAPEYVELVSNSCRISVELGVEFVFSVELVSR